MDFVGESPANDILRPRVLKADGHTSDSQGYTARTRKKGRELTHLHFGLSPPKLPVLRLPLH